MRNKTLLKESMRKVNISFIKSMRSKWKIMSDFKHSQIRKINKTKMSVFSYRHDFKPVGLTLITVFRDAVYGFLYLLWSRIKP
jgi:hypothetical protein